MLIRLVTQATYEFNESFISSERNGITNIDKKTLYNTTVETSIYSDRVEWKFIMR